MGRMRLNGQETQQMRTTNALSRAETRKGYLGDVGIDGG